MPMFLTYNPANVAITGGTATFTGASFLTRTSGVDAWTVNGSLSGADLFSHAYEDSTSFTSTGTGAYASYDTLVNMSGALAYNHFFGYEARHTYSGSGSLTTMAGFVSNGIAVSGSGTVTAMRHFDAINASNTGTITEQSAYYVADLTVGVNNYGFNSGVSAGANKYNIYAIGTAKNLFTGQILVNGGMTLASPTTITSLGATTFNFTTNTNLKLSGAGTITTIASIDDAGATYEPLFFNASTIVANNATKESFRVGAGANAPLLVGQISDDATSIFQLTGNAKIAGNILFDAAGTRNIGAASTGIKSVFVDYTNTATVGAVTINKAAGRVNIAAAATSVVVTNSLVTAASEVFVQCAQADANNPLIRSVVPAAGSFTITVSTAPAADQAYSFFVVNTD